MHKIAKSDKVENLTKGQLDRKDIETKLETILTVQQTMVDVTKT